jgi:hypothetical protein
VSEGTQQTEAIFCNTCNTVTIHTLRSRYSTPRIESLNEDDPDPVSSRTQVFCLLLCTIGLRALIEGVCNDKGFKDRKLENNIEGLTKLLPSPNMIEALHALRLFGNDAAHRLEALTRDNAREAIRVMEHLLNHFYDMDYRASQMKHPKKEAFDAIKPGSVQ